MTLPNIGQTFDDIRAALVLIESELTPNVNVHAGALYQQSAPPFWTNLLSQLRLQERSTSLLPYALTCTATYHAGYLTEGNDVESAAQDMLVKASTLFMRRPFLQSATMPQGVAGIAAEGVTLQSASITSGDLGDSRTTLNVSLVLSIPLLFETDSEDF